MSMRIFLADCVLDVDVERTRAFYDRPDVLTAGAQCSCENCRNFDGAILKASASVLDFLRSFGIDPQKPVEVYNVTGKRELEGTVWYNGWYHVCGTVVSRSEAKGQKYCPDPNFPFSVFPGAETELLHRKFPRPALQLEIDTHLPFVLPEPPGLPEQ